ncbi:MAG: hypothetical protein ACE5GK_11340 [Nitrospiria bacterium]
MSEHQETTHQDSQEDLAKKNKRLKFLYAFIGLMVILDIFAHRHHPYFFWDKIPGFSAVMGFVSCLILIFFSKGIGHAWLMKRKDYYDD